MYLSDDEMFVLDEYPPIHEPMFGSPESLMQASGRRPDQHFKDLRSANHAYQRTIKRPRKRRTRKIDWIWGYWGYNRNTLYLRKAEDIRTELLLEHPWEHDFAAESKWKRELGWMDEPFHYQTFGTWRHGQQIGDGGKGEDFGMWGRRRIEEMRRVKEERIKRKHEERTSTDHIEHTQLSAASTVEKAAPGTTLPTNDFDRHGHELLRNVLTVNKWQKRYLLHSKQPLYNKIYGFYWFGEFTWKWHRDSQGCWILGADSCADCPIPCSCCGCGLWKCECKEWEGKPAPDETQRCSLVEWAGGRLIGILQAEAAVETMSEEEASVLDESEELEWEALSYAGSEGWSVVSEEEVFEIVDA